MPRRIARPAAASHATHRRTTGSARSRSNGIGRAQVSTHAKRAVRQALFGRVDLLEHAAVAILEPGEETARGIRCRIVEEVARMIARVNDELRLGRHQRMARLTAIAAQAVHEFSDPACNVTRHCPRLPPTS